MSHSGGDPYDLGGRTKSTQIRLSMIIMFSFTLLYTDYQMQLSIDYTQCHTGARTCVLIWHEILRDLWYLTAPQKASSSLHI